jgi:flagellar M-ring protein FliF
MGLLRARQLRQTVFLLAAAAALALAVAAFPTGPANAATGGSGPRPESAPADTLSAPAQSVLDQVLGAGHSVVTASAVYGDASTTRSLSYAHRPAVVLDQSSVTAPGYRSSVTDNGVGSSVRTRVVPAGTVQRLSVAVVVDAHLRPAPRLSTIRKQVSAAMGLQPRRGDTITVARMAMPAAVPAGPAPGITGPGRFAPYLPSGAAAAAAVALLLAAAVSALGRRS